MTLQQSKKVYAEELINMDMVQFKTHLENTNKEGLLFICKCLAIGIPSSKTEQNLRHHIYEIMNSRFNKGFAIK